MIFKTPAHTMEEKDGQAKLSGWPAVRTNAAPATTWSVTWPQSGVVAGWHAC